MLNYAQLKTQVGQFIQDTSNGRETRIGDAINRRYREVAETYDWKELLVPDETSFSCVSGQDMLFLPKHIRLIKKMIAKSAPNIIHPVNIEALYDQHFETRNTGGVPLRYAQAGWSPVKAVMASAETLTLVSSSASDTAGVTVRIWGLNSGGTDEVSETVTINGTTNVPTTTSFSRITRIGTNSTGRVGIITVSGTTSLKTFATLATNEYETHYQAYRLWPVPSSAESLSITYIKKVVPLSNDADTLEIPCDQAIFELAVADILDQQHKWSPSREHEQRGREIIARYMLGAKMISENVEQAAPFVTGGLGTSVYNVIRT